MDAGMVFVFFIYGLAFFLLGFAILLFPKKDSSFKLAKNVGLIAAFGISHGINEWIDMFLLLQKSSTLFTVRAFVLPVSFLFLVQFGLNALVENKKRYSSLKALPLALFLVWAILAGISEPFKLWDIWARYLLGVPGIFLTSYALILELRDFKNVGLTRVRLNLTAASGAFLFYGIFVMVVPEAGFFPANIINYRVFLDKVGIPVQIFRAFSATIIAYNLIRILDVFDYETKSKIIASEKLFKNIFDKAMDGILLADAETKKFYTGNTMICRMLGYSLEECKTLAVMDIHPTQALPDITQKFEKMTRNELALAKDIPMKRRDGTIFYADISASVINLDGRNYVMGIFRDVTERMQMEEKNKRHIEQLASLHSIDLAISSSLDIHVTLDLILNYVTSHLKIDAVDILLYKPQIQMLEYASGRGFRTNALQHTSLKIGESHAGRVALERRIIHIPDLSKEGDSGFLRSKYFAQEGFASYYGIPLIAKGSVNGVMEIFNRGSLNPDREWLDFLNTLAGQAAVAIDNAMLFENLERSNAELITAYDETIEGWSRALDLRDKETEGHSQRVTELALKIAVALGFGESELVDLRRGALLHDIGKMGIPDRILLKPGPLDKEEMEIMRKHPMYGYDLLSPIRFLRSAVDIPYCHHEKWDGTGYPRGLKGEEIPLGARIFALADIYDALCSERPYRPAWKREKITEYISSISGTYLDPKVVEVFLKYGKEARCFELPSPQSDDKKITPDR